MCISKLPTQLYISQQYGSFLLTDLPKQNNKILFDSQIVLDLLELVQFRYIISNSQNPILEVTILYLTDSMVV